MPRKICPHDGYGEKSFATRSFPFSFPFMCFLCDSVTPICRAHVDRYWYEGSPVLSPRRSRAKFTAWLQEGLFLPEQVIASVAAERAAQAERCRAAPLERPFQAGTSGLHAARSVPDAHCSSLAHFAHTSCLAYRRCSGAQGAQGGLNTLVSAWRSRAERF